ncbi:TetR family transcriptional regulator [Rhodococcoides trifolii]|uniref:TetR family transcriptional regulator n=1 Tax=Rhodococcoides trifolii TaxID=908250 RepID=A0A917D6E9_9NOCA|nr:TetR/AcrR family transcriptional regulator C-terminal domain-containing protein [Rhodococcus trifolii]GGG10646.1 TetR family transcriptional regulator [Rhodococcus trifolii]
MATEEQRGERRTDALSKKRIVEAAIDILDSDGESALTFRALATHLATGSGALYWHVANKSELLTAATDAVIAHALAAVGDNDDPRTAIRTITSGVFDAIHAHPWVGTQLSRELMQTASMQILESIGTRLDQFGVPDDKQFDCATAIMSYILGLAAQYAAGARLVAGETNRTAYLASAADRWRSLDADEYPFVRRIAEQLPQHDDRTQFQAGIDLILVGISATV